MMPNTTVEYLNPEQAASLHRKHVRGAWARGGAAAIMYTTMLIGWGFGFYTDQSIKGITLMVVILIAINPPFIFILKSIRNRDHYELVSFCINLIEVTCYTGAVYFAGGIQAGYMLLIFAGVIAYVGVAAPRRITIAVALFAILDYNLMLILEYYGILPHQGPDTIYNYTLHDVQTIGITSSGLFGVVAYVAITTGTALREHGNNLRRRNQELDRINKISHIANRTLDLETILDSMCRELSDLFPVRYAAIGLVNQSRQKLEVVAFHSQDSEIESRLGFELPFEDFSATREVVENPQPLAIRDADSNPGTAQLHEHFQTYGIKSLLIAPLLTRGEPVGSIALPAMDPEYEFKGSEINLIQTIASQVSAAINNALLHAQTESRLDVAEHELEIGRQIQTGFLPEEMPNITGWEISSTFVPARQVAGDFYDAFMLRESGKLVLLIGDVCDKGVGAALFMVVFRSLIRSFCMARPTGKNPEDYLLGIIQTINDYISRTHDRANMFATLFICLIDTRTGKLFYVNAGHETPLLVGGDGQLKQQLDPTGPAIGLMPDLDFTVTGTVIAPGDILLSYTDGVVDSRNPGGESFTEEALIAEISKPYGSALSLVTQLEERILRHISGTDQFDDIAMLAVRRDEHSSDRLHEISVHSQMEDLPLLRKFVEKASVDMGLEEDLKFAFKLSLDEIATNIISYGFTAEAEGTIRISYRKSKNKVVMVIEDDGVAFDYPLSREIDLDQSAEQREVGGLGLYMVEEMMDSIDYERTDDHRNRLTLSKIVE
jgi:serine phosphatase RsbU (regulator of sigma subunit)/anti-sigma regulatory factor (Ser/Thr protein kinase)